MVKINKKILLLGLLAIALLIVPFHFSHAQSALDLVTNPVKSLIGGFAWIIATVLYFIGYAFSGFVFLGGLFFNWTLALNSTIVDNPIVQSGWIITRDIANLGFVLLIIIIAFSTILRLGSFQAKQALSKLIIAAILINFSLLFATVFLDAAGVFMNFFFNNAYSSASGNGGISLAISEALRSHAGLNAPISSVGGGMDLSVFGVGVMKYMLNIVFLDVMTIVSAITMFTMAIMFLIRYVYIGLLLILLPGAILMWAIGSGEWGKWMNTFFKYTFFGPIAGFFIYIALSSTLAFEKLAKDYMAIPSKDSPLAGGLAGDIASMIMMVFLLLGGLMAAEQMSIRGAKTGVAVANGAINGFLKGTVSGGFKAFGGAGLAKRASEWGKNSKSELVRGITRPLRQIGANTKAGLENYPGIMSGVFAGIDEGLGGKGRAFREKEVTQFKQREGTINEVAKKLATSRGISLEAATQEVQRKLDQTKDSADGKETALDKIKKHFNNEMDTESAMRELGMTGPTDQAVFAAAVASNQGNITEAKKALKAKKADVIQQQKDEHEAYKSAAQINKLEAQKSTLAATQSTLTTTKSGIASQLTIERSKPQTVVVRNNIANLEKQINALDSQLNSVSSQITDIDTKIDTFKNA